MVSRKPWSLEAAARLFILVLLTLFAGVLLAGLAETPKLGWTPEQRDFADMVIMTVFFHGAALVWVAFFLRKNALFFRESATTWREAFFANPRKWRAAALGLGAGIVSTPALVLLQEGLTEFARRVLHVKLQAEELVQKLGDPALPTAAKVFIGVTAVAVVPLSEEILFRGILYPTVKQIGLPRVALFGTSILFALAHASVMAFVPLMLFSMLLIWLYEACDNLLAPILAHCALNAINYYWIVTMPAGASSAPPGH